MTLEDILVLFTGIYIISICCIYLTRSTILHIVPWAWYDIVIMFTPIFNTWCAITFTLSYLRGKLENHG